MNLTLKRTTESDRSRGAEKLLESVGFSADHLHDRIPLRFRHPSKLKGIDFDYQKNIPGKQEARVMLLPYFLLLSFFLLPVICDVRSIGSGTRSGN
jgi:hypothetical protein